MAYPYDDDNADATYVPQSGPSDLVAGLMVNGPQAKAPVALTYLHAVHPDTGVDVVFTPGEALPEWAQDVQHERRYKPPTAATTKRAGTEQGKRSVKGTQADTAPK